MKLAKNFFKDIGINLYTMDISNKYIPTTWHLPTNCIVNVVIDTPSNSEIICGQNVGTKVVCGIIFFFEKIAMLKI